MGAWGHVGYAFKGGALDRVCKKSTPLDGPSEDAMQYVDESTVFQPPINFGEYSQQTRVAQSHQSAVTECN